MGHNENQPNRKQNAMKIQFKERRTEKIVVKEGLRDAYLESENTLQNGL